MRNSFVLAATLAATMGVAHAQLSLNTLTGGTNQGNVGGGIYFDLEVLTTITINQIDFRCGANTAAGTGTLDLYLGPTTYLGNVTDPQLWTLVTSTAPVAVAPSAVSNGVLNTPISLGPGNYGIALKSNSFSHGYTNGVTCTSNTIPGSCSNSLFQNSELILRAGAAQNSFLTGGVFTPRIFNGTINYSLGGNPIQVAAWEEYGQGCYEFYRSFYQLFPNPVGLNLGNGNPVSALRLVFQGGTYNVQQSNSTVIPPSTPPIQLQSGAQAILASSVIPGGALPFPIPHPLAGGGALANDLEICTKGYIVPSPASQAVENNPSVGAFLAGAPRWAPHWKNIDPAAGGGLHVEVDPVTLELRVTWDSVPDSGLATTSTFQVAFIPNGDVEFRYGTMSQNGGGGQPVIIGWTEGGNSVDPGNIEIATSLPFSTGPADNPPLTIGLSARPVLGTTFNVEVSSIPAGTAVGGLSFGFTPNIPGLDLGFIGMPGCFAHHSLDITSGLPLAPPSLAIPLTLANDPSLNGVLIFGQAISISPGFNANGVLSSNGARLKLGAL